MDLTVWIEGLPATAGSKSFKGFDKYGKARLVDSCKGNDQWKKDVALHVQKAMREAGVKAIPEGVPVSVRATFYLKRPKDHYKKDGTLKPDAVMFHTKLPDTTKLFRSQEDALKPTLWNDDSQVSLQLADKMYEYPGQPVGLRMRIRTLTQLTWQQFQVTKAEDWK